MGKTTIGRGGRPLDAKRTEQARERHARGAGLLDAIFGRGSDRDTAARRLMKRVQDGQGPTGAAQHTRKHWTRPERRAKTKAQRIARRANRA